ncbi:GTPase-associated system all-helical protein GASH [Cupriavidus sp. D39]|uniref:GTPase-associated system all-helical protein GASH n=1 Tax=Cupriavidus sp. D39 TaxID=2997877 RepID=UPI00226FFE6F|nr:GTPase-associated system all-helical protein GASH [Cupriavidus sp. D39]MCY0854991.1 GTPase-associated system all-helical protein GASH [Cupriavidus sp. D39]
MEAIKRMGVLYGKLGLATAPALIEARGAGLMAACDSLSNKHVPALVRQVLGLKGGELDESFWSPFAEKDPTFDVATTDKEAALLAGSAIAYCFEENLKIEDPLALCLVTAAFGKTRKAVADDQIVTQAEQRLAEIQTEESSILANRKHNARGQALNEAMASLEQPASRQNPANGLQHAHSVLKELGDYAEAAARASATNDNLILGYLRRLEGEVRVYWWVTSGWSSDSAKGFKTLPLMEAALRAGKELADKSAGVGLFSAPALLAMVLERGREDASKPVALAEAVVNPERAWRLQHCADVAEGDCANLMPLTTAMGMAAASEDAADWQPRFQRLTGLSVDMELSAEQLAIQLYRERLLLRALK